MCMVVAPTWRVLKDATIPSFMSVASSFVKEYKKSDMVATLRNNTTVLFRTGVEPDRLRGANLGFAWIDEAAMLKDAEVFEVLVGRLRLHPGRVVITTTPKGMNWVYDLSQAEGVEVFHSSTRENTALPEDFFDFVRGRYTSELAEQELEGRFVDMAAGLFQRQWFTRADVTPPGLKWFRFWDLAVSTKRHADYTATARVAIDTEGRVWVDGIWQAKAPWPTVKKMILEFAKQEPTTTAIGIETVAGFEIAFAELSQEPVLAARGLRSIKPSKDKAARAAPLAARAEAGRVVVVNGPHSDQFIGQATLFPGGKHDDMVDAVAGALSMTIGSGKLHADATARQWGRVW